MTRPPLRIAAHNGALSYGGGEKWTVLLLRGLAERGHDVHLYCHADDVAERARQQGLSVSRGILGGHLMISQAAVFARRLREFRPDALLLSTFKKAWLGGMAALWAGVPRVVARIGLDTDLPGKHWSYRVAFRRWVDATLVNADGIRDAVLAGLPGISPARVTTVYDGVPLPDPLPSPAQARSALGVPDGPTVGVLARLTPQKGLERFLETLALLDGVHAVIAGDGELDAPLRAHADALGLTPRVHFLGFREDVTTVLAALDVFLLTSHREGMANAMLEAMAAGVPVVSTPVSGAAEALSPDGQGRAPGIIVEGDPHRLADAVRGILTLPAVAAAMGAEGRRRVGARFAFPAMVDAWERALGGSSPASSAVD